MTDRQHNQFFLILLILCAVCLLTVGSPLRIYVPVVWGLFGFGLHAFWFWRTWMDLSKKLITEHKCDLIELKIGFQDNQYKKTVEMLTIFYNKQKIGDLSADLKISLSSYQTYFRLTIIAFPVLAIFGIWTVLKSVS